MTRRNQDAFVVGFILGLGAVMALEGCSEPTSPTPVVSCQPQVIQTPQGPWVTGSRVCTVTDPATGQGHVEVRP